MIKASLFITFIAAMTIAGCANKPEQPKPEMRIMSSTQRTDSNPSNPDQISIVPSGRVQEKQVTVNMSNEGLKVDGNAVTCETLAPMVKGRKVILSPGKTVQWGMVTKAYNCLVKAGAKEIIIAPAE